MKYSIFCFCLVIYIFTITQFHIGTFKSAIPPNNTLLTSSRLPTSKITKYLKVTSIISNLQSSCSILTSAGPTCILKHSDLECDTVPKHSFTSFYTQHNSTSLGVNSLLHDIYFALQIILEYKKSTCEFIENIASRNKLHLLWFRFYLARASRNVQIYYLLRFSRRLLPLCTLFCPL